MTQFHSTSNYRMDWGPYANQAEASICLGRFTNAGLGLNAGIIYCDSTAACLLRRPSYDAEGNGYTLVAQSHGPLQPPKMKEAPPGFLANLERFFEKACASYGRQQIAQGQMNISMGRAIEGWLSNPKHEHEVGIVVDTLGIISFAMLFVPGVGEAEMGLVGAFRAAMTAEKYWQAAGLVTATAGFAGSISGGVNDSVYLFKRFDDGANSREMAAKWDDGTTCSCATSSASMRDFIGNFCSNYLIAERLPCAD